MSTPQHLAWAAAFAFVGLCAAVAWSTVNVPPVRDAQIVCIEQRGKKRSFNMQNFRAKVVAECAVDDKGQQVFADVSDLGDCRADVLDPIYTVAAKLSGISKEDEEEMGKSSATETPSTSSSSASPENLA